MKKTKVKMNKATYLGMSIFHVSKSLMYEFWYDYIKVKYQNKAKLCYMDTDSSDPKAFIEYSSDMQDVYKNIEEYNPGKKRKILIVFDDVIADMINN